MRHLLTFNPLRASIAGSKQAIPHSQNLRHKAVDSEHSIKHSELAQGAQA